MDMSHIEEVWRENHFSLTLDYSLIIAMNDEARWMIDNHLANGKTVPDFRDYICPEGLKAVKPQAVFIFR